MNQNVTKAIGKIIEEAEKMRGAYYFIPPQNAGMRRSYEKYHSHERVEWSEGGHEYSAEYTVRCTCSNVYASGEYTKDGKRTTLTAIRNSYNRLLAAKISEVVSDVDRVIDNLQNINKEAENA